MTTTTILSDNGVSSGTAGIKTTGGNDGTLQLQTTTAGGTATTALTIDTSQNVGVGVTPSAWVSGDTVVQVKTGSGSGALWGRSNSLRVVGNTYYDGTNYKYIASDYASFMNVNQGSVGGFAWNIAPSGTAGNNATFTQAMTLDASGNLLVGSTSASMKVYVEQTADQYGTGIRCTNASYTSNCLFVAADRNTTNGTFYPINYYNYGTSTYRFRVADSGNVTNTNNSYGAISDIKLKENITDSSPKLEQLTQVRVVNYNFIGNETKQLGVIAQELEQIFPAMVEETVDRDMEGNDLGTTTKSVKYSVFVPMLIKAIQEQQALINNLTERLSALESK